MTELRGTDWLAQFFEYLEGERAYSEHTINAYKSDLDQFTQLFAKDLLEATSDDISQFIVGCMDNGISPRSARRKFAALRSFYQFLFMEGVLPFNPGRSMRAPKAYKPIVRPVTRGEVERMLASLDTASALDLRNQAIIYVVYMLRVHGFGAMCYHPWPKRGLPCLPWPCLLSPSPQNRRLSVSELLARDVITLITLSIKPKQKRLRIPCC